MLFGQCPHGGGDKLKGASLTHNVKSNQVASETKSGPNSAVGVLRIVTPAALI